MNVYLLCYIYFSGQQHGAEQDKDKSSALITSGIIQTAMILLLQLLFY